MKIKTILLLSMLAVANCFAQQAVPFYLNADGSIPVGNPFISVNKIATTTTVSAYLLKTDNLASVANKATARTNLDVYSKAESVTASEPKYFQVLIDMSPRLRWSAWNRVSTSFFYPKEFTVKVPGSWGEVLCFYSTLLAGDFQGTNSSVADSGGKVWFQMTGIYMTSSHETRRWNLYSNTELKQYKSLTAYAKYLNNNNANFIITQAYYQPNVNGKLNGSNNISTGNPNSNNGVAVNTIWNKNVFQYRPFIAYIDDMSPEMYGERELWHHANIQVITKQY